MNVEIRYRRRKGRESKGKRRLKGERREEKGRREEREKQKKREREEQNLNEKKGLLHNGKVNKKLQIKEMKSLKMPRKGK